MEITASLPDMSEYGEHLQIQTCQIEYRPVDGHYNTLPITDTSNPLNATARNLKSGAKYDTRVTVTFKSGEKKCVETENPVEIPLPGM